MTGDLDPVSLLYAGTMLGTVLAIVGFQAVLPRLLDRAPGRSAPDIFASGVDLGPSAGASDPLVPASPPRISPRVAGDASVPDAGRRRRRPR